MPVVFHVVYNTTYPGSNVADTFLLQALQEMNRDFRRLNPDWVNTPAVWQPLVADCEIEFCLAVQDPNGNPTTGITHTSTTEASFSPAEFVMWSGTGGGGCMGYRQILQYMDLQTCYSNGCLYKYSPLASIWCV
ncbi:MAG: hypothetical protein WD449_01565 [Candidatus Babeliales bacterium]